MANNTRQLLNEQNIDEIVDSVEIVQEQFTPEGESRTIIYNRLKITLSNGDVIMASCNKDAKTGLFIALEMEPKN